MSLSTLFGMLVPLVLALALIALGVWVVYVGLSGLDRLVRGNLDELKNSFDPYFGP